jgi:hypothetical protein
MKKIFELSTVSVNKSFCFVRKYSKIKKTYYWLVIEPIEKSLVKQV